MPEQVTVGKVTIMPVQDCAVSAGPDFMWPDVTEEQFAPWRHLLDGRGNLPLSIGTFVIRSEGKTVLIDTGLGDKPRENFPTGNMLENLRGAGVQADDVDLVVITHLHIDHVGWNTIASNGGWATTFPRARYVVVQEEWDYFTGDEGQRSQPYIQDSVLPLEASGQLELVDGSHTVTADLTLVPSPGHTPAHACVAVVSGAEKAIIVGDLAHHPLQLTETQWEVVFDFDKAMACRSREEIAQRMESEGALAIGGHFPWPGFGRLLRLEGRRTWQAL
jgi:glyoxylase-like metal-dependent hydrolase (beta-lactamase superfamily II)